MGDKHGPNKLGSYRSIHETVLRHFVDAGFVESHTLEFNGLGDGLIRLVGRLTCSGGVYIKVEKTLVVLDGGDGDNALVQTIEYSYNAAIPKVGNVFRYCSPHEDHNTVHHKHTFDPFGPDPTVEELTEIPDGEWPTLGEVLEELRTWYWANLERLKQVAPPSL